jgi:hypothetical protein
VYFSERFDDSGKHRLQFRKIWVPISIFRNLSYLCSPKNSFNHADHRFKRLRKY